MNPIWSILDRHAVVWRLARVAVLAFVVACASIAYLKTFHQKPLVLPGEAFMLVVILSAPAQRRWLCIAAVFAGYTAAGLLFGHDPYSGGSWTASFRMSLPLTAGVVAAFGMLRGFAPPVIDLARPRDLAIFTLASAVAAPLATVCVGALTTRWLINDDGFSGLWHWAAANALGMLILTPGLLILRDSFAKIRRAPLSKSGMAALGVLALVSLAAFGHNPYGLRYLVPPALALVAIYLEFLGVALGGLIIATAAITGVFMGQGAPPPAALNPTENLLLTQLFLAFVMVVNLPLAALLVRRRHMREDLLRTKSEAEAAQVAVAEQQRRSMMAEEIAKVGFWRADFGTGQVEWSEQNYDIVGRDRNDPPTLETLGDFTHPEDTGRRAAAFAQLQSGQPAMAAWRLIRPDGAIRHLVFRGVPELGADGAVLGAFGTVVDVTELTQAQEALAKSEAHLRLITGNVVDIIVQTDFDDRITYISPSVQARLGYMPDEVLGSTWLSLIHPEDAPLWLGALEQLLLTKGAVALESIRCRARAKDGRQVWLALRPALIMDEKTGEPVGVVDVARDVTERYHMFGELQAAQAAAEKASAVKGEFLANISHEIRTPLTSISGFTKLAEGQNDLSEETRRYIGHISSAASALLAIVNDVLDFSKLEAGEIRIEPRPTDVRAVMRDTVNLFSGKSAEKGLRLCSDYPDDAPGLLMIDPDRLRQVLINLAGNGLKFTDQGGVTLKAAFDAATRTLRVDVTDTGPGIPAESIGVLFQRFSQVDESVTRKFGGTGLGLAISKGLVEAMGGEIGVSSELGKGARFWFAIPAAPAEAISEPALANTDIGPMEGLRVLVVDDNAVNRELVRALIGPLGAAVTEAEDGERAVEQAQHTPFDVILMDLRMPGMSGRQAARAIAESGGPNASTPIIAFSADGADEAVTGDLAALGFAGRIIKPFQPMDLILALISAAEGGVTDDRAVA